jgi:hypothetical protein
VVNKNSSFLFVGSAIDPESRILSPCSAMKNHHEAVLSTHLQGTHTESVDAYAMGFLLHDNL